MKKGRVGRKLTAWLLSTAMAVGGLALGGVGTENVAAEEKKTVAGLSTSAIKGPETTATYNSQGRRNNWKGSYVWFGKYDGQPVKYRVLSPKTTEYGGTTMFLDCENILYQIAFDKDCKPNAGQAYANWWHGSDLDRSLNGSDFLWNDD